MAWFVVPNLNELMNQLNVRFPARDKSSDGSIGDTSHQASKSSHNPDRTANSEYKDGDALDEVRARDFDSDLRDPLGVSAEMVVQHIVTMARAGRLPYLRYIIFNKRIWEKSNKFATRAYTGSNPHDKHFHVNSDYTQAADTATGVNWALDEIGGTTPNPPVAGHRTLKQGDQGDDVKNVQQFFRSHFPSYRYYVSYLPNKLLTVDGDFGPQTTSWVKEFQRRTSLTRDGIVGPATLTKMRKYGYSY